MTLLLLLATCVLPDIPADTCRDALLDEVVVTATRTPRSLKDVPVLTRLITEADIGKADATDIRDLLTQEIPGLEFGYAMGQETTLSINGFGGNSVLFLVDSERLAGETIDNIDYSRLNLKNIGRVEIVKGAASSVYGANAVCGVVNLITKESALPWELTLDSRYDSFGHTWRSGADLNLSRGRWTSHTSLQHSSAETVRLADAFDTESMIHEVYGGTVLDLKERLTFRAADNLRFIARGGCFGRTSNRPNHVDRYTDYSAGIRGIWIPSPGHSLEISYSYDRYDKARLVSGKRTHDHDYSNRQHIAHVMYSGSRGAFDLTAGTDYMHDFLASYQFADNSAHRQTTFDAYAQLDWKPLEWLDMVLGVRDDYFSASRLNALTARLAALVKLRPLSLRASYAGGFRAPSLKEMYMCFDMAGIQMIYGNPDLKPERSHNFNLSLERNGNVSGNIAGGAYSVAVSCFHTYYDSRITTAEYPEAVDGQPAAIYTNERSVSATGVDVNARYAFRWGFGVSASYNFLHLAGNTVDSSFSPPRPHSATWRIDFDRRFNDNYAIYAAISGRYLSEPDCTCKSDQAYSELI